MASIGTLGTSAAVQRLRGGIDATIALSRMRHAARMHSSLRGALETVVFVRSRIPWQMRQERLVLRGNGLCFGSHLHLGLDTIHRVEENVKRHSFLIHTDEASHLVRVGSGQSDYDRLRAALHKVEIMHCELEEMSRTTRTFSGEM